MIPWWLLPAGFIGGVIVALRGVVALTAWLSRWLGLPWEER